jgi:hypothetical protein
MAAMTITLLIGAVWLVGLLAVVAICRSAARGDRALGARFDRWADTHERPLVA